MKLSTPVTAKSSSGEVTFDGDFVTIRRVGFTARLTIGKGTKSLHISHITGVQWKPAGPIIAGFLEFTLPGGTERQSKFGSQTTDAATSENAVVFNRKQQPAFERLRSAVENAINTQHDHEARASDTGGEPPPGNDLTTRLHELADLHDSGALTDDEFAAVKRRIIGDRHV